MNISFQLIYSLIFKSEPFYAPRFVYFTDDLNEFDYPLTILLKLMENL